MWSGGPKYNCFRNVYCISYFYSILYSIKYFFKPLRYRWFVYFLSWGLWLMALLFSKRQWRRSIFVTAPLVFSRVCIYSAPGPRWGLQTKSLRYPQLSLRGNSGKQYAFFSLSESEKKFSLALTPGVSHSLSLTLALTCRSSTVRFTTLCLLKIVH